MLQRSTVDAMSQVWHEIQRDSRGMQVQQLLMGLDGAPCRHDLVSPAMGSGGTRTSRWRVSNRMSEGIAPPEK
jgi:hypothetical protein